MEIIIYIAIFIILLLFKLWWDYRAQHKKRRVINHTLSAVIDVTIYLVAAWFLFGFEAGAVVLITLSARWIFYDLLYNLVNKEKWNHYGNTSKLDLFFTRNRTIKLFKKEYKYSLIRWHIAIKLIPAIIGIIVLKL